MYMHKRGSLLDEKQYAFKITRTNLVALPQLFCFKEYYANIRIHCYEWCHSLAGQNWTELQIFSITTSYIDR